MPWIARGSTVQGPPRDWEGEAHQDAHALGKKYPGQTFKVVETRGKSGTTGAPPKRAAAPAMPLAPPSISPLLADDSGWDLPDSGPLWGFTGYGKHKQHGPHKPLERRKSFGAVVINKRGQVLLRAPMRFFDGYAWTHAKGGQDKGETEEDAARREVLEETGWEVALVSRLSKSYEGSTTDTTYFLAEPLSQAGAPDKETFRIAWFPLAEARQRINDTQNSKGRERDLDALDEAYTVWKAQKRKGK